MSALSKEDVIRIGREAGVFPESPCLVPHDCQLNSQANFAPLVRADLLAENERLREQIKCGHSMELDSLARERDESNAEIHRLRRDCAEAYQVVGTLSCVLWDSENVSSEDVTKALDNLMAAANGEPRPHDDLLPFPAITDQG